MYQWEQPHLPIAISREDFVDIIFDIGLYNLYNYDTVVSSVQLGDSFVEYIGPRNPYVDKLQLEKFPINSYERDILEKLVPQEYSKELAYAVTVIMGKFLDERGRGFGWTNIAIRETNNYYVVKLEWEVCMILGFHIKTKNFISVIGNLIYSDISYQPTPILNSVFWDLSKDICMNKSILNMDPRTVVLGIKLLHRKKKLRAVTSNRKRFFLQLMNTISNDYEIDMKDLLRGYIDTKTQYSKQVVTNDEILNDNSVKKCNLFGISGSWCKR
jgi:hypothetical protein